jgi:uncharacterized protein YndB with AHSA1/START domain
MTQAKKLKKQIRARAQKTGESYTAARRLVLKQKASRTVVSSNPVPPAVPEALLRSEPRLVERTGHGWGHWFALLDAFDAAAKGHTATARHVAEGHGASGWYAQQITVQYERARGLRGTNQRMSGEYEVSVSKVLPAPVAKVVKALRDARARAAWAAALDPELRRAFAAAVGGAKGLRERERGDARLRFKAPSGVTVALYLDPKPDGRSLLVATTMRLRAAGDIDGYRSTWRQAFAALAHRLGG